MFLNEPFCVIFRKRNDRIMTQSGVIILIPFIFSRQVFMSPPAVQAAFVFFLSLCLSGKSSHETLFHEGIILLSSAFQYVSQSCCPRFEIDPVAHFLVPTSSNFPPTSISAWNERRVMYEHTNIFDVDASSCRVFEGCYSTTILRLSR